jgi:glycine dehydrogenase subunit 1
LSPSSPFRYLPTSEADRAAMLRVIGVESVDELLRSIPEPLRLGGDLDLPPRLSEPELLDHLSDLAASNATAPATPFFLGGGAYRHHQPRAVDALLQRQEFFTSYTPYQPEMAQGTLQAIFEFQSLVCLLTGLPIANASLYEGATAVVEALLLAARFARGRTRFLVAETVHPEYRETARTYLRNLGLSLEELPAGPDGRVDETALAGSLDETVIAVATQSPNFLGVVERSDRIAARATEAGAAAVGVLNEPYALGLLRGPGELGCHIAAGDLAPFGSAPSFGGPFLGFLAAQSRYLRGLPGRLAGETVDAEGRRGYVLTLSTREQHIRRGKATSNICTNQGLVALAATIGLCLLGPGGLRHAARLSHTRARQAFEALTALPGVERSFEAPFFNEFALDLPRPAASVHEALAGEGVLAALPLSRWYPDRPSTALFAATELTTDAEIEALARAMRKVLA